MTEWKEIAKQYKLKYEVDSVNLIHVYLIEQLKNATVVTRQTLIRVHRRKEHNRNRKSI